MNACAAAERSATPPVGLLSGLATLRAKASMAWRYSPRLR